MSRQGYSLGQYRLPTHKMQVYENCLRVPFLIKGPGIQPGSQHSFLAGMVRLTICASQVF
jgi:N-acetylglucosamine-6-sulfatase